MGFADQAALKSKDTTKVGCAIFGPDKEPRMTGYNGLPPGVEEKPERLERPEKYFWTSHAEENAVAMAALIGVSLKGCTAYVTHAPCARCARSLIRAGIVELVIGPGLTSMDPHEFAVARTMLAEAGVTVTEHRATDVETQEVADAEMA